MVDKCIVCSKKLKVTEKNLCSCAKNICMKHKERKAHDCNFQSKTVTYDKVIADKINKI